MRISDWSSDVCSSDLSRGREHQPRRAAMLGGDRVLHPFACLETIDKRGAIRLADDVDTVVAIGAAVIPFGAIAAGRDVIIGVDAIVIGDARRPQDRKSTRLNSSH